MDTKRFLTLILSSFTIVTIVLILQGCAGSNGNPAPVATIQGKTLKIRETYIVKNGDSIYSIAAKLNVSPEDLIRINYLKSPEVIYPGQKLNYIQDIRFASANNRNIKYVGNSSSTAINNKNTKKYTSNKVINKAVKHNNTLKLNPKPYKYAKQINWGWPAKGKVINNFNSATTKLKGVDILAREGEGVFAAASGEVVYSGNALRGYGNLVIIKHNDKFLSAYAHNKTNLVKEGDIVKKGEKIAYMGKTGTNNVKLHFEIRYNGDNVDPELVLPKNSG